MITVSCVYCDGLIGMIECGPEGRCTREKCPDCGKKSWLVHSKIDPRSYRLENVEVDEFKKKIRIKDDD